MTVNNHNTTQLCGDSFINHEIRILINQPVFHGSRKAGWLFLESYPMESLWIHRALPPQADDEQLDQFPKASICLLVKILYVTWTSLFAECFFFSW